MPAGYDDMEKTVLNKKEKKAAVEQMKKNKKAVEKA